jgi:hypothetical protein
VIKKSNDARDEKGFSSHRAVRGMDDDDARLA